MNDNDKPLDELSESLHEVIRQVLRDGNAKVGVTKTTVSEWLSGGRRPGEDMRQKLSKLLGVTVDELMGSLKNLRGVAEERTPYRADPLAFLTDEEREMLRVICGKDTRQGVDEVRWLIRAYATGALGPVPLHSKRVQIVPGPAHAETTDLSRRHRAG